jgi:hypothetical protein
MAKDKNEDLSRYVVSFEVSYPGDFAFAGRFWRAVGEVSALNAIEAVGSYQNDNCLCRGAFMATDFTPAFDVLAARREGKFLS